MKSKQVFAPKSDCIVVNSRGAEVSKGGCAVFVPLSGSKNQNATCSGLWESAIDVGVLG